MNLLNPINLLFAIISFNLVSCAEGTDIEPTVNEEFLDETSVDIEQLVGVSDSSDLVGLPKELNSLDYIKEESFRGNNPSPYGYVIRRPEGFGSDGLQYPILIFLHGAGSRGNSQNNPDDLKKVDQGAAIRAIKLGLWNPRVAMPVIAPQAASSWNPADLYDFIDYLLETYPNAINKDRIYLGGFSMGGFGVWNYLDQYGYDDCKIAAAVSLAGAPEGEVDVASLGLMPFWVLHGRRDPTVSVSRSINLVDAFREVYPGQDHQKLTVFTQDDFDGKFHRIDHGVYDRTYWEKNQEGDSLNIDIMNWMLQYKREN